MEKPLDLTGRVGFGFGLWAAPVGLATESTGGAGALGALGAFYGGSLSVRWWLRDRFFLTPTLRLGISSTTLPDDASYSYLSNVKGSSFINGTFAPSLSMGFAAYRGKSTRFLLSGGLSFGYTVNETVTQTRDATDTFVSQYEAEKTIFVGVPVGFALEQFFASRLSIVVGADSPLFSYRSSTLGNRSPSTTIGADFASTRLTGAVVFYTD